MLWDQPCMADCNNFTLRRCFPLLVGLAKRGPRQNLLAMFWWGERSAHVAFMSPSDIRCDRGAASERKRKKERTVDALALGGEEGRGKLR